MDNWISNFSCIFFLQFLVIKALDPDPYLDPDSLEILDPDPQVCLFQHIFDLSSPTLGGPVFVYDWPAASKPFYMARSREVRTFALLLIGTYV
jgi:hypothetical protein